MDSTWSTNALAWHPNAVDAVWTSFVLHVEVFAQLPARLEESAEITPWDIMKWIEGTFAIVQTCGWSQLILASGEQTKHV
jgi:hypothetical protein